MKYLSDKKLTKPDTEVKLLGNQIVLVAPKDSKVKTKIEKGFDLAKLLGDGKLAMGDVKAVPAGKYGKAALESLGAWSSVEGKVAQAENVRAALKLVSTGEARSASSTPPTRKPTRPSKWLALSRRIRIRRSSIRLPRLRIPRTRIRRPS